MRHEAAEREREAREFSQYHFSQSTAPGVCSVQTFTRWTYEPENGWSYCQATRIIRSHCPHCECGGQHSHRCSNTKLRSK
ncbi:unnamed protein product [Calicophoron daubneyi]|uniref:Uncharacterized protein n=1 Tax=Calicophoron daubneyi TaxID=300641 RepID=A0AAV2TXR7_CALDB